MKPRPSLGVLAWSRCREQHCRLRAAQPGAATTRKEGGEGSNHNCRMRRLSHVDSLAPSGPLAEFAWPALRKKALPGMVAPVASSRGCQDAHAGCCETAL